MIVLELDLVMSNNITLVPAPFVFENIKTQNNIIMEKLKVAIYCRVSTKDQNPEMQKIELENYAKAMGYDYRTFEEKESTRKTRPIKNQVFQDAIAKKYDLILIWKFDRWARSLKELVNDLDILKQHKVQFFSLKDNIKLDDNPGNMLMLHILGAFAEFERAIISERTISGLERAKTNGKTLGRPNGSKDTKRRKRSGYLLRWQKEKVFA